MGLEHIRTLKRKPVLTDQERVGINVVETNKIDTTDVHRSENMIPNFNDLSTN